jgi:hypothetical protein
MVSELMRNGQRGAEFRKPAYQAMQWENCLIEMPEYHKTQGTPITPKSVAASDPMSAIFKNLGMHRLELVDPTDE